MRNTHTSWRAQSGSPVDYATDRKSGRGVVVRRTEDKITVKDDKTGEELVLGLDEVRCVRPPRIARRY
jgi:hypothetical protein